MKITIRLDTGDDAIQNDPQYEIGRLLREAAEKVSDRWPAADFSFKLFDSNGNKVGVVDVEGD